MSEHLFLCSLNSSANLHRYTLGTSLSSFIQLWKIITLPIIHTCPESATSMVLLKVKSIPCLRDLINTNDCTIIDFLSSSPSSTTFSGLAVGHINGPCFPAFLDAPAWTQDRQQSYATSSPFQSNCDEDTYSDQVPSSHPSSLSPLPTISSFNVLYPEATPYRQSKLPAADGYYQNMEQHNNERTQRESLSALYNAMYFDF